MRGNKVDYECFFCVNCEMLDMKAALGSIERVASFPKLSFVKTKHFFKKLAIIPFNYIFRLI